MAKRNLLEYETSTEFVEKWGLICSLFKESYDSVQMSPLTVQGLGKTQRIMKENGFSIILKKDKKEIKPSVEQDIAATTVLADFFVKNNGKLNLETNVSIVQEEMKKLSQNFKEAAEKFAEGKDAEFVFLYKKPFNFVECLKDMVNFKVFSSHVNNQNPEPAVI